MRRSIGNVNVLVPSRIHQQANVQSNTPLKMPAPTTPTPSESTKTPQIPAWKIANSGCTSVSAPQPPHTKPLARTDSTPVTVPAKLQKSP
jgi:hypothetical protein